MGRFVTEPSPSLERHYSYDGKSLVQARKDGHLVTKPRVDSARTARAQKAAHTRARMLASARKLFIEHGYASTSMKAIAVEAGVAVQTLYFTFTNKRTMLSALVDVEVAGDAAPVATLERPWVAEAMAAPPSEQLRLQVAATARILSRVGPVLEVVRSAAAVDPEIAELWQTNIVQRHTVLAGFAQSLASKTELRGGIDAAQAADITLALLAPEVFHLLVHERGWDVEAWQKWATDALTQQLLPGC